jgi:hypothetical protein
MRPIIVALALALAACGPKEGAKCAGGKGGCADGQTAILCIDGVYTKVPCLGVGGCMRSGLPIGPGDVTCAHDKAEVGDPCETEGNATCSSDKKHMLMCKGQKWVEEMACGGTLGCVVNAHQVRCTSNEASVGDACKQDGKFACTPDKKGLVRCDGGKMVLAAACKGQNHCQIRGKELVCDFSLAEVGDVCENEGDQACAMDKKAILACKGNKFEKVKSCKRCAPFFGKINCN